MNQASIKSYVPIIPLLGIFVYAFFRGSADWTRMQHHLIFIVLMAPFAYGLLGWILPLIRGIANCRKTSKCDRNLTLGIIWSITTLIVVTRERQSDILPIWLVFWFLLGWLVPVVCGVVRYRASKKIAWEIVFGVILFACTIFNCIFWWNFKLAK